MQKVTTLLLDFGGVLINLRPENTIEAFTALGISAQQLEKQAEITAPFERGEMSEKEFVNAIRSHLRSKPFLSSIVNAWNAMLLDFPEHRIWQLYQLKKRYNLILMSNTNETHVAAIKKQMGRFAYKKFTGAFDAVYYSHEQGMRKPESRWFEHILSNHGLQPNEVLFVEDTKENLVPAKALGIKTFLHERNSEIKPALDKVLLALHS